MPSAFFTSASGLRNQQVKMDLIASNIANINTTGYKASSIIFSELLAQTLRGASSPQGTLGGTNPVQIGLGAAIAAIHSIIGQSSLENTNRSTDFAINGQGFFTLARGNNILFTRAGDFGVDASGALVGNNGYRVQGFNELTADGLMIDPNSGIGDIVIKFGQKLEARATSEVDFASNLDASADRFGSVDLQSVSFGSTGITTASGAAAPYAVAVAGAAVDPSTFVDSTDIIIDGNTVTFSIPTGGTMTSLELAQEIADQINADGAVNQVVQATVRNVNNQGVLVLQAIQPGAQFTVDGSTSAPYIGFPASSQTYTSPTDPGEFLVGNHQIVVTESKAATATTTQSVGIGVNAPLSTETFDIDGVTVSLLGFSDTGTSAGNAAKIAELINSTPAISVTATANANGTITLTHKLKGVANTFSLENPSSATLFDRLGFSSIPDGDGVPGDPILVNNGINARIEDTFIPNDGSPALVRFLEDITIAGTSSELSNIQQQIQGNTAAFPLIPGVVLSIDELTAGRAFIRTNTAAVHTTSRIVYDSLGNAHELNFKFTHVRENIWDWEALFPKEPQIVLTGNLGRIEFGSTGLIISPNPTTPVQFTAAGAEPTTIDLIFDGLGNPINGVTQFTGETTTAARSQDGYPMGVLTSFETDASGVISGFYSNGQRRPIAQIAIATFTNPEGLSRVGDTTFQESSNSGSVVLLRPNTGGAGSVFGGFLEQSNVDLALEFTNLIVAQRGLQANSRVFTAQDEILNEIVNLKR
ncbi:MAG: flagellar hook-basal body complex protein [bacterium]|jgi:flagellar hook protein FlgE